MSDAAYQRRAWDFTKQACVQCLILSSQKPCEIGKDYYFHFAEEKIEAQRGYVVDSWQHS